MAADVSNSPMHFLYNLIVNSPATAITDASEAHALNSTFSDTEVEAALNALGVKLNLVLDQLRALDLIAT